MKPAEKIRWLLALAMLTMMLASCSASRELTKGEMIVPPKVMETAYNLIRAKLNHLSLNEEVEIIIEPSSSVRWIEVADKSSLGNAFSKHQQHKFFSINFRVQILNKPYFYEESWLLIDSLGKKYYHERGGDTNVEWKIDSAFEQPQFLNLVDVCRALHEQRPVTIDSAIMIARQLFGLPESTTIYRAFAQEGTLGTYHNEFGLEKSKRRWAMWFALEPKDSTAYYALKSKGRSIQDAGKALHQMTFICWIDADSGELCAANWSYNDDDLIMEGVVPNPNLHDLTARIDSVKREKAREYFRQKVRE